MKTTEELLKLLATWPGIAILVTLLVQIAKNIKWVDDKREPQVAVVLGAILAVTAKASGLMVIGVGWSGYLIAVIGGILAGGIGGQIHDYAVNPIAGMVKALFKIDLGGRDDTKPPEKP